MTVLIAGGGMTGATLALAISHLTQGALPVTLIESSEPASRAHPGYDGRAIALSAGTCQQLANINLWQRIAPCATPITTIHVSDRGHAGFVSLTASDYAIPALGQVVELFDVGQRLFAQLKQAPGVTLRCPARVTNVNRTQAHVKVTLDNDEQLDADVLVAADGTRSAVAAACGIQWQTETYQQLALIANVTSEIPHQGGPLNGLLSSARSPCCRCLTTVCRWCGVIHWISARSLSAGTTRRFSANFSTRSAGDWGNLPTPVNAISIRWHCNRPNRSFHIVLPPWATQPRRCTPIAGQGFNLGLRDVMSLAETTATAHRQQQDPAAMLSCSITVSVANRIGPRPSVSPTIWCACLPTAMHRWSSGATLACWQWIICRC